MANISKKPKQKTHKPTVEELRKRDAMALAQLIYDIHKDKKRKEHKDASS